MKTYVFAQNEFRKTPWYGEDAGNVYANPVNGTGFPDIYEIGRSGAGGKEPHLIDRAFAEATTPERPRAGYWFVDIVADADGPHDFSKQFGLCAVPAEYSVTGRSTFVVDSAGTIYIKDTKGKPVTTWPDLDNWLGVGAR